jgi:selenocysteine-specific elongation factor
VRSVQVHDRPVDRAAAGQRVALNLAGTGWREIGRGDVVCLDPGAIAATYLVDARVELEPEARALERGTRVHVHHGTREAPARVVPLGGGYAQLRLEAPLVPVAGDRLILRQVAPPDTIGGGVVVDPRPRKHGPDAELVERLEALARGEEAPVEVEREPSRLTKGSDPFVMSALDDAALSLAALLRADGASPRADGDLADAAGLSAADAAARFAQLERAGQAVRVGRNLHFDPAALDGVVARVVAICERDGSATIASVRDELGSSRRYAQAVLEHLDAEKVTLRRGDEHVLRRQRRAGS